MKVGKTAEKMVDESAELKALLMDGRKDDGTAKTLVAKREKLMGVKTDEIWVVSLAWKWVIMRAPARGGRMGVWLV